MIKSFDSIEEFQDKKVSKKETKEQKDYKSLVFTPKIAVLGIGGSGTNAINNLIKMNLANVMFLVANTDVKSLEASPCTNKIRLGIELTKGLGAGSNPEIGFKAAEKSKDDIAKVLEGIDLLFLIAGMGGGTGTGASSVIAQIAKELNILTLGFVTKPFKFEGNQRMEFALNGLKELEKHIDSLIIMSNQNLFKIVHENTSMLEAFRVTDNVIYSGIKAISDLITDNGMVNLDFNDIKFIIENGGKAVVTSAEVTGKDKVNKITDTIINNPLIDDDISIVNAKNILISIAGGLNMTLFEIDKIINGIRNKANKSTYINFGAIIDESMKENVRVSVIATGIYNNPNTTIENYTDGNSHNSKETVSKSIINNVLKEDLQQKEKLLKEEEINVESSKSPVLEQTTSCNPFNEVTENLSQLNISKSTDYLDVPLDSISNKTPKSEVNSSSLLNFIEEQNNNEEDEQPINNKQKINKEPLENTKEVSNKNNKSFFELPPFLRK